MFYVIVVKQDGIPGKLFGPMDWDAAMLRTILAITSEIDPITDEKITLDSEDLEHIQENGEWDFDDGGGVYIIKAED